MKALKPFCITLAIVIAVGAIFLAGKSALNSGFNLDFATTKFFAKGGNTQSTAVKSSSNKKRAKANPITKAIVAEAINSYAEKENGATKKLIDSMSAEDKDTVLEIIALNVTLDSISDLEKAANSNDPDAILNYAKEHFSEEDYQDIQEILEKYQATP